MVFPSPAATFPLRDGIKTCHRELCPPLPQGASLRSRLLCLPDPPPPPSPTGGPRSGALPRSSRGPSWASSTMSRRDGEPPDTALAVAGLASFLIPAGFRPRALRDGRCRQLRREIRGRARGPAPAAGAWGVRGAVGPLAVAPAEGVPREGRGQRGPGSAGAGTEPQLTSVAAFRESRGRTQCPHGARRDSRATWCPRPQGKAGSWPGCQRRPGRPGTHCGLQCQRQS